ncbi:MAG: transporter substrate-binding domain-containing protein [Actinomycetota bacterium]
MFRTRALIVMVGALAMVAAGCGSDDGGGGGTTGGTTGSTGSGGDTVCATNTTTGDLLADICERGEIKVSTDPAYPPASSLNEETGEYEGFDIDTATEIAKRLGVEIGWETPSWDLITAGSWNGRWDMSVGSMTPTTPRQEVLYFTPPYYYTPAVVLVNADNTTITDVSTDLDGKKIGVCAGCTYEAFLQGNLDIGVPVDYIIDDPQISGYDTDTTALQDLSLGDGTRLDAVITSLPIAQGYIDAGNPVKIVGDPVFYEPLAVAFDKSSELDATSLLEAVSTLVDEMHADGTLSESSEKWFGLDLTVAA